MKVTDAIARAESAARKYGGLWHVIRFPCGDAHKLLIQPTDGCCPEGGETLYTTEPSGTNVHIHVGEG